MASLDFIIELYSRVQFQWQMDVIKGFISLMNHVHIIPVKTLTFIVVIWKLSNPKMRRIQVGSCNPPNYEQNYSHKDPNCTPKYKYHMNITYIYITYIYMQIIRKIVDMLHTRQTMKGKHQTI